jgi:glucose/mannose-6-phosphate isomerase
MDMKKLIKNYDTRNQFRVLINSYKQIEFAWDDQIVVAPELAENIDNIIVAGMGGSAISAGLLNSFLKAELKIPLIVASDYYLPVFANQRTLVIISSYSGNTEETVSCFKDAMDRKCKIVALSTGGWTYDFASDNDLNWLKLQDGFQPRYALGVSFFSLLKILQTLSFIPDQNNYVNEIKDLWKKKGIEYSAEGNIALKYAETLVGFIPIIYTSAGFESVGYRWKCQFNENSKLHAFNNIYPELNHNEIVGWETFSEKQFNAKVISIVDVDYHPRVLKRIEITNELISKNGVEIITLKSNEENIKVRIMDLIYLGDWITYYLSILRAHDPTEIDNILEMKKRLA